MPLEKLARELEETARQTSAMVDGISMALAMLSKSGMQGNEAVRDAMALIITSMQGQDRIEQRCHNIANAVRQMSEVPPSSSAQVYDEIWANLTLDELRVPKLSGIAAHSSHGDAELF